MTAHPMSPRWPQMELINRQTFHTQSRPALAWPLPSLVKIISSTRLISHGISAFLWLATCAASQVAEDKMSREMQNKQATNDKRQATSEDAHQVPKTFSLYKKRKEKIKYILLPSWHIPLPARGVWG